MYNFFERWLAWAQAGAITDQFDTHHGLCLAYYRSSRCHQMSKISQIIIYKLETQQDLFPFGGIRKYARQSKKGAMHLNKKRLKWVRKNVN